ncbi:GNAT family N-acetyltransferase [Salinarimonas soli]|uniref:GNAT family N-acetyltransferase n=1 Tax=Salinarimonas soli TaxID=1638099 RepID=A0A5B2V5J4_9HYPH|nr:GNAT family N-acetyltransferase [Salinarimonas soli]KAA2233437.1 GNAT family N-acetyltransferase [Salinarimonas soli]
MDAPQAFPALSIRAEDPAQPDVRALLRAGEAFSAALYPAESNHHLPLDALRAPGIRFLVARDGSGRPLATGALALHDGWAEIKRMWVVEEARGRGLSRAVLDALIGITRDEGVRVLRLETGIANHAALGLYRSMGFRERGPFADYGPDPLSVFMERAL